MDFDCSEDLQAQIERYAFSAFSWDGNRLTCLARKCYYPDRDREISISIDKKTLELEASTSRAVEPIASATIAIDYFRTIQERVKDVVDRRGGTEAEITLHADDFRERKGALGSHSAR